MNLATSKTKQCCETSSIFQVGKIKNEAILRDILQNGTLSAELTASYQCGLRFFHSTCLKLSKALRLPRKVMPGHTKCSTCHAKIIFPKLVIRCSKMQPLSGNLRPDLLTTSTSCVSCTAPVTRHASFQIFFKCPTPAIVFETATKPACFAHFWQGAQSPAPATQKRHLNVQECSVPVSFLHFRLLTSECASRHDGVPFFNISTSQKCSERGVLCTL